MSDVRLSRLEAIGTRWLQARAGVQQPVADEIVHQFNAEERAAMLEVERSAIVRAAVAGVLSGVGCGVAELLAQPLLGPDPDHPTTEALVHFWGVFAAVNALITVVEIAFLYWSSLDSVRRLAGVTGLPLDRDDRNDVAVALARAALELPSPIQPTLGVNPHTEASKAELIFATLAYKLKVAVTNFVFKALVRQGLGRAATRAVLAFTAVPVNAVWNGVVAWLVMREARIRVMGPSAAVELFSQAVPFPEGLSLAARDAMHQAVGSTVVRTRELHPNAVAALQALRAHLGPPSADCVLDQPARFLAALAALPTAEGRAVLRVLSIAAILDGRLVRREKALLREARARLGMSGELDSVVRLLADFRSGRVIPAEDVMATG